MGRPVISEEFRKDEIIKIRLTKSEKKMCKELSDNEDICISDYIRKLISEKYFSYLSTKNGK